MTTEPMLAPEICQRVLAELRQSACFVRIEHGLNYGSVADIIAVDEQFHGFEIKSERDSTARLKPPGGHQIRDYSAVFDRVTVVAAHKHVASLKKIVPRWWGITVAEARSFGGLETVRFGDVNPSLDPTMLARLLWLAEMRDLAKRLSIPAISRMSRFELAPAIAAVLPLDALRAEVRHAIRSRDYERDREPAESDDPTV